MPFASINDVGDEWYVRKFNDSPQDRHKTDGHNKMNENKVACGIKTGHKSAHDNDSVFFLNEMNNFVENFYSSITHHRNYISYHL